MAVIRLRRLAMPFVALLTLFALAACGGTTSRVPASKPQTAMAVPKYTGKESFVWCVPYARFVSGIQLRGDAHTWWASAAGKYKRDSKPALGSILSMPKTSRLSRGHIAVVTAIEGPRRIKVSHANWGWNRATRGKIYEHMPVLDVSENNDWSKVRLMHPATNAFGRPYKADGFIHNRKGTVPAIQSKPRLQTASVKPPLDKAERTAPLAVKPPTQNAPTIAVPKVQPTPPSTKPLRVAAVAVPPAAATGPKPVPSSKPSTGTFATRSLY
ncbi:MAG: CHAP domain-containing protein [Rhodospirillaceae bacterium]